MSRLLRAFSMVVTDRRWAAPMSAAALGFGIFAGVAIGPSASGTLAGAARVIELVDPTEEPAEPAEAEPEAFAEAGGSFEAGEEPLEAFPSTAPLAPAAPPAKPAESAPAPAPEPPPAEEPAAPQGTELEGTVVHVNRAAGSYTLAIEGGELVPVHARELPEPGAELTVNTLRLANGTFAEQLDPDRTGNTAEATVTGVVTWVGASSYALSGRGASLLVSVAPDPTGTSAQLPVVGAYVKVAVAIEGESTLEQRELTIEPGEPSTYLDLAGIAGALTPETSQLLFSADDTRASEADLALAVPPEIDAARLVPGDSYLATAEVQPDGSLLLKGIASDEHHMGADDASTAQGDLRRPPVDQP